MTTTAAMATETRDGIERRQKARVALCVEVGFLSDSNFYVGFTEDISEGGLFVATHMLKEIGTELMLTFRLPNEHEVTVQGVVRWLRDPFDHHSDAAPGMGVELQELSESDLTVIREFVSLRAPLFHDH